MKRLSAMASVFGLFVAGVMIGALAVHIYDSTQVPPPRQPPGPGSGGRFGARGDPMPWMEHELALTDAQRREIRAIVDEARAEADALRAELGPRMREQMERTRERIRALLGPEQQARFDELHEQRRAFAERFLLGHGGRGRRGPPHRGGGPPTDPPPPVTP